MMIHIRLKNGLPTLMHCKVVFLYVEFPLLRGTWSWPMVRNKDKKRPVVLHLMHVSYHKKKVSCVQYVPRLSVKCVSVDLSFSELKSGQILGKEIWTIEKKNGQFCCLEATERRKENEFPFSPSILSIYFTRDLWPKLDSDLWQRKWPDSRLYQRDSWEIWPYHMRPQYAILQMGIYSRPLDEHG